MKGERKGERSRYRQDPVISIVQMAHQYKNPYGKRERGTGTLNHMAGRKAQSHGGHARPNHHTVGRQSPTGKQRPSPGRQRSSPARAPTRTSRRVGIGQGDLLYTKEATSTLRMQGDHKEQHGSHSLNRWKERFAL